MLTASFMSADSAHLGMANMAIWAYTTKGSRSVTHCGQPWVTCLGWGLGDDWAAPNAAGGVSACLGPISLDCYGARAARAIPPNALKWHFAGIVSSSVIPRTGRPQFWSSPGLSGCLSLLTPRGGVFRRVSQRHGDSLGLQPMTVSDGGHSYLGDDPLLVLLVRQDVASV